MRPTIVVLLALAMMASAFAAGWKWKSGASPTGHVAAPGFYSPAGWSWGGDEL